MQILNRVWHTRRLRKLILRIDVEFGCLLAARTMSHVQHETVTFSGHVQGVGFRYATLQVAREFEVSGFVSNLLDGRVHLEIEGQLRDVGDFVDALEERMHGYICKTERESERREPVFSGFEIR